MPPRQRRHGADSEPVDRALARSEQRLISARQHIEDSRALLRLFGRSPASADIGMHQGSGPENTVQAPALILVVDDQPDVRHVFTTALASGGFRAVSAESAEHAWALMQAGLTPDAVLLDLWMPGLGGLGLLLQLRANPLYRSLPTTIVTADCYIEETTRSAAVALGAHVRFKPLRVDEIVSLVRRMLGLPAGAGAHRGTSD
jgi:CheY-like chemotaxis protein